MENPEASLPNTPSEFNVSQFNYLRSINADTIDEIYSNYLKDSDSVDPSWKFFFDGVYLGEATVRAEQAAAGPGIDWLGELKVYQLIQAYREQGHLIAQVNPILDNPGTHRELELETFALSTEDLQKTFVSARFWVLKTPLFRTSSLISKKYIAVPWVSS